ncbi:transporter substrate-binding domain-containing protein [Rheinheimera sp.]|uniref:substrate-binding periplasmic protein n=1 Tax=Rheinheimera sp. TaxID=1869214 RepID=UPI00307E5B9E
MNNYRLISSVVFCVVFAGCKPAQVQTEAPPPTPAVAAAPAAPEVSCQLKVGYESWEPYQFRGYDEQANGLDIDIVNAVAKGMSCELIFSHGNWQQLLAQFRQGELDVLLGASKTPAREEFALFSEPYRNEQFQLFVRKTDADKFGFESVAQMVAAKHKVGVVSDYYYGDQVSALYADEQMRGQFVESAMSEQNLALLLDGQVDGMLEDNFVGRALLRRKGLSDEVSAHQVKLPESPIYVMFSKQKVSAEQVGAFNQQLMQLKQSGQYQQLVGKYQG